MQERLAYWQMLLTDEYVTAEVRWYEGDPYAVTMRVHTKPEPVKWTFALDLLTDGGGEGDVLVYTFEDTTNIVLFDGKPEEATLTIEAKYAKAFLDRIPKTIPIQKIVGNALDDFLDSLLDA